MDKKLLLLVSTIVISSIAHAEINMPSAPVYDMPSSSTSSYSPSKYYKEPSKTVPNTQKQNQQVTPAYKTSTTSSNNYTEQDKKEFYDAFESEFFNGLSKELLSQGFREDSVSQFTDQLKSRFNRKNLENSTWGCVSKYPINELTNKKSGEKFVQACFSGWVNKYMNDNSDLATKYLKK